MTGLKSVWLRYWSMNLVIDLDKNRACLWIINNVQDRFKTCTSPESWVKGDMHSKENW